MPFILRGLKAPEIIKDEIEYSNKTEYTNQKCLVVRESNGKEYLVEDGGFDDLGD